MVVWVESLYRVPPVGRVRRCVRAVVLVVRVCVLVRVFVRMHAHGALEAQKVSGPPVSRYTVARVRCYPYPYLS